MTDHTSLSFRDQALEPAGPDRVRTGQSVGFSAPFGVAGLFRDAARAHPDRLACVDEDRSLTYRRLDLLSDALAGSLTAAVGAPGPVALRIPRGTDVLVAMLGVLKTGRAYLPIALAEPTARVAAMVRRAAPAAVIDCTGSLEPSLADLPTLSVRGAVAVAEAGTASRPLPPVGAHDPMYIMFTSGSTGEPKGVVQGSRAVCNRLQWMRRAYDVGPDDRILQKTPYTFDVSGWELFLPLISGCCCVFAPEGAHRDPSAIAALIARFDITLCHFVPSVLAEFVRTPGVADLHSLRAVFTSGEALSPALARRTLDVLPADLHNLYGPTEAAIDVTSWTVPRDLTPEQPVLIGSAIDNTRLFIVGPDGRTVPAGEPGELWIGGLPVAEGYAGRPDLTEAAFPTAFGGRCYRTGDLTRWTPAGIEYLGRIDSQVKVDGVRVEPTEVEAAFGEVPGVEHVMVVPIRTADAATRLVAFIVAVSGDTRPDDDALRQFAADRLPPAFLPSAYFPLRELPLSPNGKADRGRLCVLAQELWDARTADRCADPMSTAWVAATGADASALQKDAGFLASGGTSLGAVRLAATLRETLLVEVPVRLLLDENYSLAQLRKFVAEAPRVAAPAPVTTAERATRSPLTPAQQRLWLLGRLHPESAAYNVVSVLRVTGSLDRAALVTALDGVLRRHDALRARVVESEDAAAPELRYAATGRFPVSFQETAELTAEALEQFAAHVAGVSVSDARAPMARMQVLVAPGDAACLVLTASHLIADQQALDILLGDIATAYSAARAGTPTPLPPAPSHAAYAATEVASAKADSGARDLEFWRRRLAGAPAELDLPFRRRAGAAGDFEGAACSVRLDRAAADRLRAHLRAVKATTASFTLAAFAKVLAAWSNQKTVVIGVPSSRRRLQSEQQLVGFLVDTLPIRIDVAEHPALPDLVAHVRERYVEALEHSSVPFDQVVRALGPGSHTDRTPVFQAWFNDLTGGGETPRFAGLHAQALIPPVTGALFELGLYLHSDAEGLTLRLIRSVADWPGDAAAALLDQVLAVMSEAFGSPAAVVGAAEPLPEPGPVGPRESALSRIFEAGALHPDEPAIVGDVLSLTHGALRAEVDRLAASLREAGVGAGSRVEVRAARSPYLAVAVLAVWQACATLALLDGSLPGTRLEYCASTAEAAVLLEVEENGVRGPLRRPGQPAARQGQLSHILFTSGSSGFPAAVGVPHGPLRDFLEWYTENFRISSADRFALLSGLGHDPVLRDLFAPLYVGGRLYVPSVATWSDPTALRTWLARHEITVAHMTPGLLELMTSAAGPRLDGLRLIVVGGAPLRYGLVRAARAVTGAKIVNAYGSTETPQIVACHGIDAVDDTLPDRAEAPVGRAVNGHQVWIRTPEGRPARIGELGEIVVRSGNLAAGYLDGEPRSGFSDPDCRGVSEYRTGDLARLDPSGLIHLSGRADRQVNLGGNRVELGEVEAASLRHEGVRFASAALQDSPIGPVLTLHVGLGQSIDGASLRSDLDRHLRAVLPPEAVPGSIRVYPPGQFPGPRKAALDTYRPVRARAQARPTALVPMAAAGRGPTVDWLIAALSSAVGRTVGETEHFFDAGLNSVMLLNWHAVLVQGPAGPFPVTAMFSHSNARELAGYLDELVERLRTDASTAMLAGPLDHGVDRNRGELRRNRRLQRASRFNSAVAGGSTGDEA